MMRVLVTGGSGLIGAGVVPELLAAGYEVRLLARDGDAAAQEWDDRVEGFMADIADRRSLRGAADDCDAVLHVAGIVTEQPPKVTFARINVSGTRNILAEARRAEVPRFVYVSSLGADRGTSAYHASKRDAEALVQQYEGSWAIMRPGSVYGPGDEVISQLLQMHRTLPAVPLVGFGDQEFQPIFYQDLGKALAIAIDRYDLVGEFELAGDEITTSQEILERFAAITGRAPAGIAVPEIVAGAATSIANAAGVPFPLDESKFQMLLEGNVIEPPDANALMSVFAVTPTPLDEGLAVIADLQPEVEPSEGVGALEEKRYWADIADSSHDAGSLMTLVRDRCTELMDVEFAAEPDTPQEIVEGVTLTASLPLRGNIQVRVEEVTDRSFTFATLQGHPLAGTVTFETDDIEPGLVRFSIIVRARAATMFDWFAMNTIGRTMQNRNWRNVVAGVIEVSGGVSAGVQHEDEVLDDDAASDVERDVSELITRRKRQESAV